MSTRTTPEWCNADFMAFKNGLTLLINEPTYIPSFDRLQENTLGIFLTLLPHVFEVKSLPPLVNSNPCTISVYFSYANFHHVSSSAVKRDIFICDKADWAGLNNFFKRFN